MILSLGQISRKRLYTGRFREFCIYAYGDMNFTSLLPIPLIFSTFTV